MQPPTGRIRMRRRGRGLICGSPVLTGRADPGRCWCRPGGRRHPPPASRATAASWGSWSGVSSSAPPGSAEDAALIGIKSAARLLGAGNRHALVVFYTLAVVLIGVALGLAGAGWPAWLGLIAFAAHLALQIRRLDISDPALCLRVFKSNRDAGLLLFAGLLVDAVMRA